MSFGQRGHFVDGRSTGEIGLRSFFQLPATSEVSGPPAPKMVSLRNVISPSLQRIEKLF